MSTLNVLQQFVNIRSTRALRTAPVSRTVARGFSASALRSDAPKPVAPKNPEELAKALAQANQDALKATNAMTQNLAMAAFGNPDQQKEAQQNLANMSDKMVNQLAQALNVSPNEIKKLSKQYEGAVNTLLGDLQRSLQGDKGAQQDFLKDLEKGTDQVGTGIAKLLGASSDQIRKARDEFHKSSQNFAKELETFLNAQTPEGQAKIGDAGAKVNQAITNSINQTAVDLEKVLKSGGRSGAFKLAKDYESTKNMIGEALADPKGAAKTLQKESDAKSIGKIVAGIAAVGLGYYLYTNRGEVKQDVREKAAELKQDVRDKALKVKAQEDQKSDKVAEDVRKLQTDFDKEKKKI